MPEVISPCPACGGNDLGCWEFVVCKNCEMRGPRDVDESAAIAAWNALPRALRWTHEPPKVAGPFFLRDTRHKEEAGIVHISSQQVTRLADKGPSPFIQYAGPIPSPID